MAKTSIVKRENNENTGLTTNESQESCVMLLNQLYNGKFWVLPMFAQSLVNYLCVDLPQHEDPRVMINEVAMRGMFILQKTHELGEEKAREEEKKRENGPQNSLYRDMICILIGITFFGNYFPLSCCALVYITSTTKEYNALTPGAKKMSKISFFLFLLSWKWKYFFAG